MVQTRVSTSRRLSWLSLLLLSATTPLSWAQFGVAGNKRKPGGGTGFQELQERAKQQAGGGGDGEVGLDWASMQDAMEAVQKQYADLLNSPEAKKLQEQFAKMKPEDLMQGVMQQLSTTFQDGSMIDTMLQNKEILLQSLESSGMIQAEELAKFKADPEYFESNMRESLSQMKEVFANPDTMSHAMDAITSMADAFTQLLTDDDKLEEARLTLLKGGAPGADLIPRDVLEDATKFKELMRQGVGSLAKLGDAAHEEL